MSKRKWIALIIAVLMFLLPSSSAAASTTEAPTFTDVPLGHWAYSSVESVYAKGLMSGIGGGKFEPDSLVTEAEMAQTLYNVYEGRIPDNVVMVPLSFNDVADDAWYRDAVHWAARTGFANWGSRPGNTVFGETGTIFTFGPTGTSSGRMMAVIYLGRLADAMNAKLPEIIEPITFPDARAIT